MVLLLPTQVRSHIVFIVQPCLYTDKLTGSNDAVRSAYDMIEDVYLRDATFEVSWVP